jgi:hypothetical protein
MVAVLVGWGAGAWAADDLEAVLRAKGLSRPRGSVVYLLQQEEAELSRMGQRLTELEGQHIQARSQYQQTENSCNQLESQANGLRAQSATSRDQERRAKEQKDRDKAEEEGKRLDAEIRRVDAQLNAERARLPIIAAEVQRTWGEYQTQSRLRDQYFGQMRVRYEELDRDGQVKEALRDLNRGSKTKFVLGPVTDNNEVLKKLRRQAEDILNGKGMVSVITAATRSHIWTWPSEQALGKLIIKVERLWEEVKPPPTPAMIAATLKQLEDEVEAAKTPAEKFKAQGKLETFKKKCDAPVKPPRAEAPEEFRQALAELRQTVDRAQQDRDVQDQDAEIKDAIAQINKAKDRNNKVILSTFRDLHRAEQLLAELE